METTCKFCKTELDITSDPLYSSEHCNNCGYYYYEEGNTETEIFTAPKLIIDKVYHADSGFGSLFEVEYKGIKNGKHFFKNLMQDWKTFNYNLTDKQVYNYIKEINLIRT